MGRKSSGTRALILKDHNPRRVSLHGNSDRGHELGSPGGEREVARRSIVRVAEETDELHGALVEAAVRIQDKREEGISEGQGSRLVQLVLGARTLVAHDLHPALGVGGGGQMGLGCGMDDRHIPQEGDSRQVELDVWPPIIVSTELSGLDTGIQEKEAAEVGDRQEHRVVPSDARLCRGGAGECVPGALRIGLPKLAPATSRDDGREGLAQTQPRTPSPVDVRESKTRVSRKDLQPQ
jgi:hypothetical protein